MGTATEHIAKSTPDWINNHRLDVRYGDISSKAQPWEQLTTQRFMAKNSKGKMVYVEEVGYKADVEPTHLIVQITAGCTAPFEGCPGNTIWVDNIRLVY